MYKQLYKIYEGKPIGNNCDKRPIFSFIRGVNMANALNQIDRGHIEIKGKICFINNPEDYSNYQGYMFRPIFFDDEIYDLLYTKEELLAEGYSQEQAEKMVGYYKYMGKCHSVAQYFLEEMSNGRPDVKAITSLTRTIDDKYCFHSYICFYSKKNGMEMIIDFTQNIMMPKYQYDELMVEKELNILNYTEYVDFINNSDYNKKCKFAPLLYLALIQLQKIEDKTKKVS